MNLNSKQLFDKVGTELINWRQILQSKSSSISKNQDLTVVIPFCGFFSINCNKFTMLWMIILIKLFLNSKLDLIWTVKFVKQLFRIHSGLILRLCFEIYHHYYKRNKILKLTNYFLVYFSRIRNTTEGHLCWSRHFSTSFDWIWNSTRKKNTGP